MQKEKYNNQKLQRNHRYIPIIPLYIIAFIFFFIITYIILRNINAATMEAVVFAAITSTLFSVGGFLFVMSTEIEEQTLRDSLLMLGVCLFTYGIGMPILYFHT